MHIAGLNEKVTIQKQQAVTDKIGNHTNEWTDYLTVSATISGEGGSDSFQAGQTLDKASMAVTIRWSKKASSINPTGYRILHRGILYNILSVDHFSYKKKAIKFACMRQER